MLNKFAIKT